ncbi:MAG: phosphoglycerate kinase [Lentisphaerae bacterium RIFOXYC12_FULL_60_16]|nr:MAG: phosphoglycerate kinase [Lentisphaerae bacterium RIFOXYC12_FULL_60_16]
MNKKTVRDVELKGQRVLMRVDFNVPIQNHQVDDDTRIQAALPTILYVLEKGARHVVLMSHLGRPDGKPNPEFSLKPVAEHLQKLLGRPIQFATDCVGPAVAAMAKALPEGGVLLLENLRFYLEEEGKPALPKTATDDEKQVAKKALKEKQKAFAAQLAVLGDVYVNDAFGTAHRAHASISVVTRHFKDNVAGFLMEKEIEYLGNAVLNPKRPFVAILGGAKISGKIDVLMNLIGKVDAIIVGGGMVFTFYKAMGIPVGNSLVETDRVEIARETLAKVKAANIRFLLPVDHVIADAFKADARVRVVGEKDIPDGWMALDIGPKTRGLFAREIHQAQTVVWNGPMGCFEMEPFAEGTMAITRAIAEGGSLSIVGGGDSVNAVNRSGLANRFTHISTGGGASLEFLEGKELPGVVALSDR